MDDVTRRLVGRMATGESLRAAGAMLGIGADEARGLVEAAMRETGARSLIELVLVAMRRGLLD